MDTIIYAQTLAKLIVCELDLHVVQDYRATGEHTVSVYLTTAKNGTLIASYDGIECDGIAYLIDNIVARYAERNVSEEDELRV